VNHIHRITAERDALADQLRGVRDQLAELERYLTSAKFAAPDADYVHVRTDVLPKVAAARFAACV
jgi:hypothetical protein